MPTVRGIAGAYRFFFYSFDCNEPAHVHVKREGMTCKFWLDPVSLAGNDGFPAHELTQIRRLVASHHQRLLESWHEHCGD
ncbi:DUF4160 domain-containing protein [Parasulfuritortus cantonensis]|uniref:DUF4160 domain-containing protein n=1 Tax=Parasulfuritortus cantonensis TaxID=2528202 RepID=A0A4R1B4G3_9PROT|nr:DUF4160 domain-containing protein [Parasulfuritortus cantonensis]TCJ12984.1 DUF4160 domain-containing protein [Parasulfuritortus cantonensis]